MSPIVVVVDFDFKATISEWWNDKEILRKALQYKQMSNTQLTFCVVYRTANFSKPSHLQ